VLQEGLAAIASRANHVDRRRKLPDEVSIERLRRIHQAGAAVHLEDIGGEAEAKRLFGTIRARLQEIDLRPKAGSGPEQDDNGVWSIKLGVVERHARPRPDTPPPMTLAEMEAIRPDDLAGPS
jgi:hypothetical protein